jgi:hypothetical protein
MKYSFTFFTPARSACAVAVTISSSVMFLFTTSRNRALPASGAKVKLDGRSLLMRSYRPSSTESTRRLGSTRLVWSAASASWMPATASPRPV